MYLCLSSGTSKRYLDDIVRILAMPCGAYITFRYRLSWLSPKVKADLADIERHSPAVLIAYVDQAASTPEPTLVPCRMGRIIEVHPHGTTVSVVIELQEFAMAEDLSAFEATARKEASCIEYGITDDASIVEARAKQGKSVVPSNKSGKLQGFYWLRLVSNPGTGVRTSSDLGMFERIAEQLAVHEDFKERAVFYTVTDIRRISNGEVLELWKGRLELSGNADYEVRLYHFLPKGAKASVGETLGLKVIGGSATLTSNPVMALDSPYDWKAVRFKTQGGGTRSESLVLGLERSRKGEEIPQHEFDLPADVKGRLGISVLSGLGIGVLLASPEIAEALGEDTAKAASRIIVAIVSSVLVGLWAVFGLKKLD